MHFFGCTNALFEYDISTIGYGCCGETNNVGRTRFISFKNVFTLSLSIQEIIATCRNPSLGFATKARVCKSLGQEKDMGVWESVRMNSHTPK
jgi:hypothetical protein